MELALRGVGPDADIAAREHRELFAELAFGRVRIIDNDGRDSEPVCRLRVGTNERVERAPSNHGGSIAGALDR